VRLLNERRAPLFFEVLEKSYSTQKSRCMRELHAAGNDPQEERIAF
jgi:hypothetical protein